MWFVSFYSKSSWSRFSPTCVIFACTQDPAITGFHPALGPVSGGSRLTVIGQHLDIGSHVTTVLTNGENATVLCRLYGERLSNSVRCKTSSNTRPSVMTYLVMSIDSARVNYDGQFHFMPDPVIESVMPFKTIIRYFIVALLNTVRVLYITVLMASFHVYLVIQWFLKPFNESFVDSLTWYFCINTVFVRGRCSSVWDSVNAQPAAYWELFSCDCDK